MVFPCGDFDRIGMSPTRASTAGSGSALATGAATFMTSTPAGLSRIGLAAKNMGTVARMLPNAERAAELAGLPVNLRSLREELLARALRMNEDHQSNGN